MEIKYPKYTREKNRACKLTDNQIEEIKLRHEKGETYPLIAKDFNVTAQAIFYWCQNEEKRKKKNQEHYESAAARGYISPTEFDYVKYRERKKELHPELTEYENQFTQAIKLITRPNHKVTVSKHGKTYWKKYKEKLIIKNKEYQLLHLDKFRQYNKKFREIHPNRVKELAKQSYLKHRDKKLAYNRMKYREKHPILS